MYTEKQDAKQVEQTLHDMKAKNLTPSIVSANSVLHMYCRKGDIGSL